MTTETKAAPSGEAASTPATHFDVLIVGAGISGLGAAYELKQQVPGKSFAILEAMESFGGTWQCHRFPGARSDSDLFTYGYRFKPWLGAPIASRAEILKYLGDVIEENDLGGHIRYHHRIMRASWCSAAKLWTVAAEVKGERVEFTCAFLWMCQGYYRHSEGYTPEWEGMSEFRGPIIHPQTWPVDLDHMGKRVVVIGSGATSATIVPAIAGECAHVTLLQRSPTYFGAGSNNHRLADVLREINIDAETIHDIVRKRIVFDQIRYLKRALSEPEAVKRELLADAAKYLPQDVIDEHFTPSYRPWQQRIAAIPDGDLFRAIRDGHASVVTGEIERFTSSGILLKSGREIAADVIVTATGFNMCMMGDIEFAVDDRVIDFPQTIAYRGIMFTGIPNMAWVFGYFRGASWTLRLDLVADFVCRLLNHMDATGAATVRVALRPEDEAMERLPWIDGETFNPGYLMRALPILPRRLDTPDWTHSQEYWVEKDALPEVDLDDTVFVYTV